MNNPWKEVALDDYENHMALNSVFQLQTLADIMREQFSAFPITSAAVLGVAGGNGLDALNDLPSIKITYGVDINASYLEASAARYPMLAGRYSTVLADINDDCSCLPHAELVIANLFIEYVGCANFEKAIRVMEPEYVSCVIQIDPAESFVSDSPYTDKLEVLDSVHAAVDGNQLIRALDGIGYKVIDSKETPLPNGKVFRRMDFKRK